MADDGACGEKKTDVSALIQINSKRSASYWIESVKAGDYERLQRPQQRQRQHHHLVLQEWAAHLEEVLLVVVGEEL